MLGGVAYLDVSAVRDLVEFDDADLGLVEAEGVDDALGAGAVGAVRLGEDSDDVLGDELVGNLLGGHLAFGREVGVAGHAG